MTSAAFGSVRKCVHIIFGKKMCAMFTGLAILCCHLVRSGGETKPLCKPYAGKKRPKKGKIRSPNGAWKGYLKTWDWSNSQSSQRHIPWTPQGGLTTLHMSPQLQGPTC